VRSGGVGTDKMYTGQQMEANSPLGTYFYHARFYSTTLGHFLSSDPTGGGGQDRYGYGRNPLSLVDPSGLTPACPGCIDDGTAGVGCDTGPDDCSLQEPIEIHPIAQLTDIVLWWSTYYGVDPALVMAVIAWESQQGFAQLFYNQSAYAGLKFAGELGMKAVVAGFNAVGAFFGEHDDEPDWGIANITLSNAKEVLDLIPAGLKPGTALGVVDQLQTVGGAVMYAAAIMYNNMQYVSSDSGLTTSEQLILLYSSNKGKYAENYFAGADWVGPTLDSSNGNYVTGTNPAGGTTGEQGATFLNNVMPLVDQARATIAYCSTVSVC
jgi:RHS repeat-associated protein